MEKLRSLFSGGIRFKIFSMLLITIVLIIAAVLMILMQLISTVFNCIAGRDVEVILEQVLYFILNILLSTALLLTAILWKPAKAE